MGSPGIDISAATPDSEHYWSNAPVPQPSEEGYWSATNPTAPPNMAKVAGAVPGTPIARPPAPAVNMQPATVPQALSLAAPPGKFDISGTGPQAVVPAAAPKQPAAAPKQPAAVPAAPPKPPVAVLAPKLPAAGLAKPEEEAYWSPAPDMTKVAGAVPGTPAPVGARPSLAPVSYLTGKPLSAEEQAVQEQISATPEFQHPLDVAGQAERLGQGFKQELVTPTVDGAKELKEGIGQLNDAWGNDGNFHSRDAKQGLTKTIGGLMTLSTPLIALELGANPTAVRALAAAIAGGYLTGHAARRAVQAIGLDPDSQDLAETLGNLAGGAAAAGAAGYRPGARPEIIPPEPATRSGLEPPTAAPPVEGSVAQPERPQLTHPAGKVTGIDEHTGLPIVDRTQPSEPARTSHSAPSNEGAKPEASPQNAEQPIGATDPETGRTVLHASGNPEVNQAHATAEHPEVKDTLAQTVKEIPGAKIAGARAEKDPERLEEKIEGEGQSPETARDYSGFRIAVDSPEAHQQVVQALRQRFEVPEESDEFDKGADETGFHGHTMQVREPGSPVTHEVQILPREVAEAANGNHPLYEKAREGDQAAAAELKAKNEADWQAYKDRNGREEPGEQGLTTPGAQPEKAEAAGPAQEVEPRDKFGSTQANLPETSEAHSAVEAARSKIADADLAGDGKDIDGNHVTVRYGVQGGDPARLRAFLESQPPFEAKLGKTEKFAPTENSDGAAVIQAPVQSPDLERINKEIAGHADFKAPDFKYTPHVTVAYVKPETAAKYVGMPETEGKSFRVDQIAITDRNGRQELVSLKGQENQGGRGESPEPRARLAGNDGSTTSLLTPTGELPARYRMVEADSLVPSHNAQTFAKNPEYPEGVQERAYDTSKEAQARVIQQGQNYDPRYTVNSNPDAVNGPPVVTPDGTVLGGNSRAMSTQRLYAAGGDVYKDYLRAHAAEFGLQPEQVDAMQKPVLVREVAQPAGTEEARRLGSDLNKSMTGALGVSERAVSAGKNLRPETLRRVSTMLQEDDSTLRELLARRGGDIARMLESDGAITARERPQFVDKTGGLSEEGKTFVERALLGSVLDDPRLMDRAPKSILQKVERSMGSIASFAPRPDEWNILPALRQAVAEHAAIEQSGSTVETHLGQRSLFGEERNPVVDTLVRALAEKPNAVRAAIEAYARDADANQPGQSRMFGTGDAYDAFNHAFGGKLTEQDYANGLTEASKTDPANPAPGNGTRAQGDHSLSPGTGPDAAASGERSSRRALQREPKPEPEPAYAQRRVKQTWSKGDSFLLRDPKTGAYVSGTVEHFNPSVPGGKAGGRARLSDGTKLNEIPADARPIQTIGGRIQPISGSPVEREIIDAVERDPAAWVAKYMADPKNNRDGVLTIATDAAKELFPQFRADPVRVDRDAAAAGSRINKMVLKNALAEPVDPKRPIVQIPTAVPGTGKTATNSGATDPEVGLKVESIMDEEEPAANLLNQILDSGRRPHVMWIYADDIGKSVDRMFRRAIGHDGRAGIGRTVQLNYMTEAYKNIPETLEKLQKEFGDRVDFTVTDNSGGKDDPHPVSADLQPYIDEVREQPYTRVRSSVNDKLDELHAEGLFKSEQGKASLEAALTTDRSDAQNPREAGSKSRARAGEESRGRDDEDVSREPELRSPLLEKRKTPAAPTASDTGGGGVSEEAFAKQIDSARARSARENAAQQQASIIDTNGGHAVQMDADAYALWHRSSLGEKIAWRGMTLPKPLANRVTVMLRGLAGTARTEPGGAAAAAGYDRLVKVFTDGRNPDGSLTLLRGDWRPDTLREERWHGWALAHKLNDSEAVEAVARRPEFKQALADLREMGYGKQGGSAGRNELVSELLAKAFAGDPDLDLNDDERGDLVRSFLTAAADGEGPRVFRDMPETDPRVRDLVQEVQREYGASGKRSGGEAARSDAQENGEAGEPGPGVEKRALHGGREGQPTRPGVQQGDEKAAEEEGELGPRYQRSVAKKERPLEPGRTWYLKSERLVDDKMRGPMQGADLLRMLRNNGVKEDELKWTGLAELAQGKEKVTPEEVKAAFAGNALRVEEVVKQAGQPRDRLTAAIEGPSKTEPRFSSYQLPGGKNYKEMLLTLPPKPLVVPPHGRIEALPNGKFRVDAPGLQASLFDTREEAEAETRRMGEIFERPRAIEKDRANFRSSHWNEPNVLAHVRFNDRATPDGKNLLHLEEIQSDWHQKGRAEGYQGETSSLEDAKKFFGISDKNWEAMTAEERENYRQEMLSGDAHVRQGKREMVPDAPFKKDWQEMAFRRMVRYAAEHSYDGVSWTPGEQQAERYDLSKQISRIDYGPSWDGSAATISAFDKNGSHVFTKNNIPRAEWPNIVGKDIAQKMDGRAGDVNNSTGYHSLTGVNLKTGGEGMKGFYDKIIPDYANKFGKPFGAKVQKTELGEPGYRAMRAPDVHGEASWRVVDHAGNPVNPDTQWRSKEAAQTAVDRQNTKGSGSISVPYLPVTDAMRESVVREGVPLFQRDPETEGPVARSIQSLLDDLDKIPHVEGRSRLWQAAEWTGKAEEAFNRATDAWKGTPSKVQQAIAKTKLVFASLVDDYRNPLKETDWKKEVGELQLARAETALKLQDLAQTIKDAAPDRLARIGMTHWIEANGDPNKLREWSIKSQQRWENAEGGKMPAGIQKAWRDAVKHYQAAEKLTPEQKQIAQAIKGHLDQMLKEAKANGLLEYGARNYVRHLYEKDAATELLRLIDNSELNPDPSFIEHRVFQTYFDAEQEGQIPRNKDIGYLVSSYDKSFSQALASRTMLKNMLDAKARDGRPLAAIKGRGKWVLAQGDQLPLVMEQRERPASLQGYREYDLPQTRGFLFEPTVADLEGYDPKLFEDEPGQLAFRGDLIFHPEVASRVEDMLTPGWFDRNENLAQRAGNAVLRGSGLAKELMTAVAPFHIVQEGIHSTEHKVNPFRLAEIDLKDKTQRLLASNGLALSDFDAEGLFSAKALKGLGEGVPGVNVALDGLQAFSRWQFEDYIPKLKMQMAKDAFERNVKRYPKLSERQAAELSAKEANAAFGNLNTAFDAMHRSKTFKQLLRLSLFAPDFLEARMRFVGQAFSRYGGEQRSALIRGALIMYATARIINALLNHGDAKWNHEDALSVIAGKRRFSLRTVQGDILHAVTDPRGFVYNRMNPLITRPVVEFLSGRDQMGRQKSFPHQARDLAKSVLPFGVQQVLQTSDEGWLNSILTSTGLQSANYRTPAEEETHKYFLQGLPDFPDDEEREAANRHFSQLERNLREGEIKPADVWAEVKDGKLTPRQAARTITRANKTQLQNEFASGAVRLPQALEIFEKANPVERMELRPELAAKGIHQLPEIPEGEREKLSARWRQLLQSVPAEKASAELPESTQTAAK